MGFLTRIFSPPKIRFPSYTPAPVVYGDPERFSKEEAAAADEQARERTRAALRSAGGRSRTLLFDADNDAEVSVGRKTLLGQ